MTEETKGTRLDHLIAQTKQDLIDIEERIIFHTKKIQELEADKAQLQEVNDALAVVTTLKTEPQQV